MAFLVTCEHGSNQVPSWLEDPFLPALNSAVPDLDSGIESETFDAGALDAATSFSRHLRCPLLAAKFSPAIVDVNRTLQQRGVFSPVSRKLSTKQKNRIISEIHEPYQKTLEATVERLFRKDELVIHISVRSFATFEPAQSPETEDRALTARRTDLGLLYDPARKYELALCLDWYDDLFYSLPMLRVRRNYPRRGAAQSLMSTLRQKYSNDSYIGVELQLNRAWCVRDVPVRNKVFGGIAKSLVRLCNGAKQEQEAA